MVTVIGYDKRLSDDDREFFTLTIQGGVEVVQSQNGNLYMTAKKMSIPSTFNEEGCKMLIGKELPGDIEKVECEPYEYTSKRTGEIFTLTSTCVYVAEGKQKVLEIPANQFVPVGLNENSPFALV